MRRCEEEWTPAVAAGVQALVREMCGRCLCENGEPCPFFSYAAVAPPGELPEDEPEGAQLVA